MPRDGSQIYHVPPGTPGIQNATIGSTPYNGFLGDIEQDLNAPRPIVAGGTGATNAHDAMVALNGEIASQVVTNYDSFPFQPGSFYSAAGATSAPVAGHAFIGICYGPNIASLAGAYQVIEARDVSDTNVPHTNYVRTFNGTTSTWGPWTVDGQALLDLKVNRAGDTMTGTLIMAGSAAPQIQFAPSTGATKTAQIYQQADTLGFGAAGVGIYQTINLLNGATVFSGTVKAGGAVTSDGGGGSGSYYFGNTGAKYLAYDGSAFNLAGGVLNTSNDIKINGSVYCMASPTTGSVIFGNVAGYLNYNGSAFILHGGALTLDSGQINIGPGGNILTDGTNLIYRSASHYFQNAAATVNYGVFGPGGLSLGTLPLACGVITASGGVTSVLSATNGAYYFGNGAARYLSYESGIFNLIGGGLSISANLSTGTQISCGYGYQCKAGVGGGFGTSYFNLMYNAGLVALWVDSSNLGNITVTSDYRIKKDVIDLPGMWDTVKALRPIKYTQAEFMPPSQADHIAEMKAKGADISDGPMFVADDIERWGFIAHELQETLVPSASTGVKDSYDHVQSPNPFTMIAALTKALQEAMTRIEALEAR